MRDAASDSSHNARSPQDSGRLPIEPPDPFMTSIQPGSGVCMRLELAWGRVRRAWLKTFRRGYVERMRKTRRGEPVNVPHEVLDPRDLKFYRNQGDCGWAPEDDPFAWRDRLPFARVGLAELLLIGGFFALLTAVAAWLFWPAACVPAVLGGLVAWFFRDPHRRIPAEPGLVVSPADGKVVTIAEKEYDEHIGGPAVTIGIFLSIFNVHINRIPVAGRVIGMTYHRGKFLNALLSASVEENEQLHLRFEEDVAPHRRFIVKQIAGAIARRIVCWVRPGESLARGAQFGMIKLGSRTELIMPREPGLEIRVKLGQHVAAGSTVMACYAKAESGTDG
ncbi:MAG: phosphatidylserine decarboxylase family protein [Pirellulales bacterium]